MKKLKLCDGCSHLKSIWKNHEGKRYCKTCWGAHKPTANTKRTKVPLPSRSKKRIKEEKEYSILRIQFLTEHPMCEIHVPGICTQYSTDIHHALGRIGKNYLDPSGWYAGCRACHNYVELHPVWAKEKGFSKSRL